MRKARAVVMAGKLPSAVRSVGFGDCGRSVAACDAGKPGPGAGSAAWGQALREGERETNAARLRGGGARSGLAHPPWPLAPPGGPWPGLCLSPQMHLGVLYGTLGTLFRTEADTGPSRAGPGVRLWHIKF